MAIVRRPSDRDLFVSSNPFADNFRVNKQALRPQPQNFKDVSSDKRKGFSSFYGYQKRAAERDAYQAAHMTPSGTPGVLNLAVVDAEGQMIPFAPFEWNGRQMLTDSRGMIKYIEKDYFQTAISLENERQKYVTQMVSLVTGQPAENVIAIFGYDFYRALAGDSDGPDGNQARFAQQLYVSYITTAGLTEEVGNRKLYVFKRYSDAEASPEVMCNFGDNDPEWSRAFNKLSLLIEYHPSAIIFDHGTLNPLESAGVVHGDKGTNNVGPPDPFAKQHIDQYSWRPDSYRHPDSNWRQNKPEPPQPQPQPQPPAGMV